MIEVEFKTLTAAEHVALVNGSTSLVDAIGREFLQRGVRTRIHDAGRPNHKAIEIEGRSVDNVAAKGPMSATELMSNSSIDGRNVTLLVNVCCPPADNPSESLLSYADDLMSLCNHAARMMNQNETPGCIINHCMLPAMYADTGLEDQMSILRGAITGVTRSVARRFGKQGIRCVGVQTGLIDLPECKHWISEKVAKVDVPTKRWGTAKDVAKLIGFLALEGSYITGQTIILDGGLTAGISGT